MGTFMVGLKKDYFRGDQQKTVGGVMPVEADSQEEAESKVEAMMTWPEPLQTTDPRIEWDESWDELDDDGWEYEDFTFEVVQSYE